MPLYVFAMADLGDADLLLFDKFTLRSKLTRDFRRHFMVDQGEAQTKGLLNTIIRYQLVIDVYSFRLLLLC